MKKLKTQNAKLKIGAEKGIALVMVLVLSAIGLGLMTTLIYMITSGIQVSGMQKRYKTALEASMGGKDIVLQVLSMKDSPLADIDSFIATLNSAGITAAHTTPLECFDTAGVALPGLQTKLRVSSTSWSSDCSNTLAIDPSDSGTYDMMFKLGTSPQYTVYAKIVDTVSGSEVSESKGLRSNWMGNSNITPPGVPNLYTVEVRTENSADPREKAQLQVLYQY